jgi:hypothetical protein
MIYWFSVYTLVTIGVMVPFVLLYLVALSLWLSFGAIRFMMHGIRQAAAVRRSFPAVHWSMD